MNEINTANNTNSQKHINHINFSKSDISNMFDNIAVKYDLINHVSTFGIDKKWRSKAIREAGDLRNKHIIDLATGTGDIAIRLCREMPAKITAVDISENMLFYAAKKVKELNLESKIELIKADSESLPFDDNTFDVATMGFGIRNCVNPIKALTEINRVLKPGAKVVILEFSEPDATFSHFLIRFYLKKILPLLGRSISHNKTAYNYLHKSINNFPAGVDFLNLMAKAEFVNLSYKVMTFDLVSIYTGFKSNSKEYF